MKNGGGAQTRTPVSKSLLYMGIVVAVATLTGIGIWLMAEITIQQNVEVAGLQQPVIPTKSTSIPQLTTNVVLDKRDRVWEIAFLPTKQMLFTERKGTLNIYEDGKVRELTKVDDIYAQGEGGLLGLAVDPKFSDNHYIYTCFNSKIGGPDIRVARWKIKTDFSGLEDRQYIITGISSNPSGRHSGCRVEFGPDGYLWVGTGDSATAGLKPQRPQDPKSLNGKILRVDRDGKAAPGNLGGEFDSRIYNYGHRNIQGLAFFAQAQQGALGVSVEHGSGIDDEVNPLLPGNFGWDPDKNYTEEGVPMTDKTKFPQAVSAIWSSGSTTQAPSGATFLRGVKWKAWDGMLAVCFLKDKKLKILQINEQNKLVKEENFFEGKFGRLRAAVLGPDGKLYLSTDNGGGNDQIISVTPY
jgi:glucose/arabinose dehydrogenase